MGHGIEVIRVSLLYYGAGAGTYNIQIAFYLFFPVGIFYYFNRPSHYEKMLEDRVTMLL